MYQKLTIWSEPITLNGLERWSKLMRISLQLIPAWPSVKHQVRGPTVSLQMLAQTSIELMALAHCLSGWMTTVSCGSFSNFCRSTTICEKSTESKSSLMVACDNLEGTYGGEEMTSLMAVNPSLMKISVSPSVTSPNSLCSALTMHSLPITFRMSTISPRGSALVLRCSALLSFSQLFVSYTHL